MSSRIAVARSSGVKLQVKVGLDVGYDDEDGLIVEDGLMLGDDDDGAVVGDDVEGDGDAVDKEGV